MTEREADDVVENDVHFKLGFCEQVMRMLLDDGSPTMQLVARDHATKYLAAADRRQARRDAARATASDGGNRLAHTIAVAPIYATKQLGDVEEHAR